MDLRPFYFTFFKLVLNLSTLNERLRRCFTHPPPHTCAQTPPSTHPYTFYRLFHCLFPLAHALTRGRCADYYSVASKYRDADRRAAPTTPEKRWSAPTLYPAAAANSFSLSTPPPPPSPSPSVPHRHRRLRLPLYPPAAAVSGSLCTPASPCRGGRFPAGRPALSH